MKTTSDEDRSCQFGRMPAHTMYKGDQTDRKHFVSLLFDLLKLEKCFVVFSFFLLSSQMSDVLITKKEKALCSIYHCSCSYWPYDAPSFTHTNTPNPNPPTTTFKLITSCKKCRNRSSTCVTVQHAAVEAALPHVTLDQTSLTLGLLRGLEERPVDAPLTERDLTNRKVS